MRDLSWIVNAEPGCYIAGCHMPVAEGSRQALELAGYAASYAKSYSDKYWDEAGEKAVEELNKIATQYGKVFSWEDGDLMLSYLEEPEEEPKPLARIHCGKETLVIDIVGGITVLQEVEYA